MPPHLPELDPIVLYVRYESNVLRVIGTCLFASCCLSLLFQVLKHRDTKGELSCPQYRISHCTFVEEKKKKNVYTCCKWPVYDLVYRRGLQPAPPKNPCLLHLSTIFYPNPAVALT